MQGWVDSTSLCLGTAEIRMQMGSSRDAGSRKNAQTHPRIRTSSKIVSRRCALWALLRPTGGLTPPPPRSALLRGTTHCTHLLLDTVLINEIAPILNFTLHSFIPPNDPAIHPVAHPPTCRHTAGISLPSPPPSQTTACRLPPHSLLSPSRPSSSSSVLAPRPPHPC